MTLYSKLGSYPKAETDGTDGWEEVPAPPVAGDGQEVVWWYPPGWVVRPVKPDTRPGYVWDWSQSEGMWVESQLPVDGEVVISSPTTDSIGGASAISVI